MHALRAVYYTCGRLVLLPRLNVRLPKVFLVFYFQLFYLQSVPGCRHQKSSVMHAGLYLETAL